VEIEEKNVQQYNKNAVPGRKIHSMPKIPEFSLTWQQGSPGTDFNGTIGSATLENLQYGANI